MSYFEISRYILLFCVVLFQIASFKCNLFQHSVKDEVMWIETTAGKVNGEPVERMNLKVVQSKFVLGEQRVVTDRIIAL